MTYIVIEEEDGTYSRSFHAFKRRARQKKPYKSPLPYVANVWDDKSFTRYDNIDYYHKGPYAGTMIGAPQTWGNDTFLAQYLYDVKEKLSPDALISRNEKASVNNKALSKISDQLDYISNLFEAWYERREAYSLLGKCLRGVATFAKNWKNPKYLKKLVEGTKTKVKDPKTLPQAWLLYNFAIAPLVQTIDDVINLLCQDMPVFWVEGSSILTKNVSAGDGKKNGYGLQAISGVTHLVKYGVEVKTLNPNAALLNTFGLTTPVSTALSVVPWMWAVNYFANVNDLVSNFEHRWPGVELGNNYKTTLTKSTYSGDWLVLTWSWYRSYWYNPLDYISVSGNTVNMVRDVNVPLNFEPEFSYPALGSKSFANLTSAIALAFAGAKEKKK